MALRSGHGKGRGKPHVEVSPVDELPAGIPEESGPAGPSDRGPDGRFRPGNRTSARGGRRKAGAVALARRIGLSETALAEMRPHLEQAERWRRHKLSELAAIVGGGRCGAGPASI